MRENVCCDAKSVQCFPRLTQVVALVCQLEWQYHCTNPRKKAASDLERFHFALF